MGRPPPFFSPFFLFAVAVTEFNSPCIFLCVNSTPPLAARVTGVIYVFGSEKLRKHERQGDSLTEREGSHREERAWKTP